MWCLPTLVSSHLAHPPLFPSWAGLVIHTVALALPPPGGSMGGGLRSVLWTPNCAWAVLLGTACGLASAVRLVLTIAAASCLAVVGSHRIASSSLVGLVWRRSVVLW